MGLRILYGVNGEGLGHATRSQVVAGALLERHDVRVVTSGGALAYLRERLPDVEEVFGPSFAMENGEIRRWATVRQGIDAPSAACRGRSRRDPPLAAVAFCAQQSAGATHPDPLGVADGG